MNSMTNQCGFHGNNQLLSQLERIKNVGKSTWGMFMDQARKWRVLFHSHSIG